jgi:hypothetical protein
LPIGALSIGGYLARCASELLGVIDADETAMDLA